mmetsp:Transcript_15517/g.48029  ORF Transcript_15517/g.48029 Transcript_15517/m.48029 type:complete len:574 (+) Transcript_15517:1383-3104(+)
MSYTHEMDDSRRRIFELEDAALASSGYLSMNSEGTMSSTYNRSGSSSTFFLSGDDSSRSRSLEASRRWHDLGIIDIPEPRPPTPIPYDRIAILVMVLLGDTICMSMVMPFIPFMVQRFLKGPEHSVGYYAGLLGAAYQLGQICFPFWGRISDRVGRRPVMIGCLAASCVWILLFGAAPTLSVAFACRFAHGLCAGNVVVAKAMMADITDRSNENGAFVFVGLAFSAGAMIGPLVGGMLAEPADKYPGIPFAALWRARPYLLPCLFVALLITADVVAALYLLQESRRQKRPEAVEARAADPTEKIAIEEGLVLSATDSTRTVSSDGSLSSIRALLQDPVSPFRDVCLSFFIFGTGYMAYQEVFPIFCRAPSQLGGLGLSSTSVGFLQAGAGVMTLFGLVAAFPAMADRYGVPVSYGRCLLGIALCYLAPPLLAARARGRRTPWFGLLLANGAAALANQVVFASFNVMLKNCAPPALMGAAIGGGELAANIGFALGPLWGGSLFAASSAPDAEWLGLLRAGRFFFVVAAGVAVVNAKLAFALPVWPESVEIERPWKHFYYRYQSASSLSAGSGSF